MTETNTCPKCGAELPANAPAGICPKCLLEAGLASNTQLHSNQPEGEPTTPMPTLSGFLPPEPDALAEHFPQLDILELLGKGGMGAVYKARQRELDRLVAVKILPPAIGQDPAFAERFMREARALARLNHQNIVQVYDFGRTDEFFYFIMEFVDGVNLRHTIETGNLEPGDALAIVPQICEALQFAHDEGIVHRDIKPENILMDQQGRVKIADFGLAKLLGQAPDEFMLTGTHQVMGTLHYMAPEQMQGTRAVDHRADIYSLGVVFYEMLTGELPIGRFQSPSKKVQVDVRLDEVVLRSLEQEPDRRYQNVSEIKTDIDNIAGDAGSGIPEYVKTAAGSKTGKPVTVLTLWRRLTWLPARLTWEALLLFFIGWVITGASWNFGPWGLLAGGCAMTVLGCVVAIRCRNVLTCVRAQPATGPWSRIWVQANVFVSFLLGWFLFVAAIANMWTVFVDFPMLNGDPTNFVTKYQGREHHLIRQLSEFENKIPDVEFTGRDFNFDPLATTMKLVWACFFSIGGVFCIAGAFRGVLEGSFSGLLGPYWRPCFGMAALMGTTLLVTQIGAHLASMFHGNEIDASRSQFAIHASTGQLSRTAHANAELDAVMATIEHWLDDQAYKKRFSNSWQLDTVPDGHAVALVKRLGCFQGWFGRWSVGWTGPTQRTPALEIVCLSSVVNRETIVRIQSSMGRKDTGTVDRWKPLVDSLKTAIESTESN